MSTSLSTISGITSNWMAEVPQTISVQAVGTDGVPLTTGGEALQLLIEQECTYDSQFCSESASSDSVASVPIYVPMTDNGDGSYEADYTVIGGSGTVTASVYSQGSSGTFGQYFMNQNWSGTASATQVDSTIDFNYGTGNLGPLSAGDYVSARWLGYIKAPSTGSFTFSMTADDYSECFMNGQSFVKGFFGGNTPPLTTDLIADILYPFRLSYYEGDGAASISLYWESADTGLGKETVPASAFYQGERLSDIWNIEIAPASVPSVSTVESGPASVVAGNTYTMTLQSRSSQGVAHTGVNDAYSVQVFDADGIYQTSLAVTDLGSGLHEGTYSPPTVARTYTIVTDLTNDYSATDAAIPTVVDGSPYTLTVVPGPPDPHQCYVEGLSEQTASVAFEFTIQFVDSYGNLHYETLSDELANGMTVSLTATYDNHDEYLSPIGVPDEESQAATTHTGTLADNNDGTMSATLSIDKAGEYLLSTLVNSVDVQNSPLSFMRVVPSDLNVANCVPVDVPSLMYTGLPYSFLIQGRDSYDNNVLALLETAVGTDHSATIVDSEGAHFSAVVSDSDLLGVYRVNFELPQTLEAGVYDIIVHLGGHAVHGIPSVTIEHCSNQAAHDLNLISGIVAGETTKVVAPDYVVGEETLVIDLPTIELYCTTSAARGTVQEFVSATVTKANGRLVEISEDDLASYGLTLVAESATKLSLHVFTDDLALVGVSIDLILRSASVQEPSWETLVQVTINFKGFDGAPTFDLDSVSEVTLQLKENETGVQFFSPVFLQCVSEWSSVLPSIVGEESGFKFGLTVDLDTASDLISFDPTLRQFKLEPPTQRIPLTFYTVTIEVKNQSGLKSVYSLQVGYRTCAESDTTEEQDYVPRYDKNPPTPFIKSISQYGLVTVGFNETMQFEAALEDTTQQPNLPPMRVNRRRLVHSNGSGSRDEEDSSLLEGMVLGSRSQNFSNYSLINNSTVLLDGEVRPSIQVSLVPADPETSCSDSLNFKWELVQFQRTELQIQLFFETPMCVSGVSREPDELIITFFDQRLFVSETDKMILPQTVVKSRIKSQIAEGGSEQALLESMTGLATAAVATTGVVSIIFGVLLKGAMRRLLNVVKSLQIILHVLLIQVVLVTHTQIFVETLQGIVFANLYDRNHIEELDATGSATDDEEADDQSGQDDPSAEPTQINSVTIFFIGAPLVILVIYLSARHCSIFPKLRVFCKKQEEKTLFNRVYLFFDGSLLLFLVSSTITVSEARLNQGGLQILNFYCAVIFVILNVPITLAMVGYLYSNVKKLGTGQIQDRIGAVYSNFEVKKDGRPVLAYLLATFARRIALGFFVTLGRTNVLAQLLFVNYSSLALIVVITTVRPFTVRSQNVVQLANEFSILLLICHCITQTEFVQDPVGRSAAGWSLNTLVILNVAGNMGYILVREGFALYRKLYLVYQKRQMQKRKEEAKLKKQRIDSYRRSVLMQFSDDLAKEGKSLSQEDATRKGHAKATIKDQSQGVRHNLRDFDSLSSDVAQEEDKENQLSDLLSSKLEAAEAAEPVENENFDEADQLPEAQLDHQFVSVKTKPPTQRSFNIFGAQVQQMAPKIELASVNFPMSYKLQKPSQENARQDQERVKLSSLSLAETKKLLRYAEKIAKSYNQATTLALALAPAPAQP